MSFLALIAFSCNLVFAADYRVLIIPDSVASQPCLDTFIYEGSSEFFANQVINRLNISGTVEAPTVSEVREKLSRNQRLNIATRDLMLRFKKEYNINYMTLKKLAQMFETNKILLITTSTDTQNYFMRRTFWDVLNIPAATTIDPAIKLSTYAVLIDTDRDVNIWEDTFYKTISSCESRMVANQMGPQTQQLEKIRDYSRMLGPQIAHYVQASVVPSSIITKRSEITYGPKDFDNVFTKKFRWYKHGAKAIVQDADNSYTEHLEKQRERGVEPLSDKIRRTYAEQKAKNAQRKIDLAEKKKLKKEQIKLEKEQNKIEKNDNNIQNINNTKTEVEINDIKEPEIKQTVEKKPEGTKIIEIKDTQQAPVPENISNKEHLVPEIVNDTTEPKIKYYQPKPRLMPEIRNNTINDI